jgi:hypothetical protein
MCREWDIIVFTTLASLTSNQQRAITFNRADAGHQVIGPKSATNAVAEGPTMPLLCGRNVPPGTITSKRGLLYRMRHPQAVGDNAQMIMV